MELSGALQGYALADRPRLRPTDRAGNARNFEKSLAQHKNTVYSLAEIYENIWQEKYYYGANNTVMVHIRNLRKKIEDDPSYPTVIKTSWGKGYYSE